MPTRLIRTLLQTCALLLLWLGHAAAQAQTVNWVSWTDPVTYPSTGVGYTYTNGTNGTLNLPDGVTNVNVTLTGEVINFSCFAGSIAGCPPGYWRTQGGWSGAAPAGTFTSANVPGVPTNANMLAMAGYVPAVAQHTLTFDQPVTNIVMTIFSLGGTSTGVSAYEFDQDFTLLSQNPTCAGSVTDATPANNCLTVHGRTLAGQEGMGTLQFTGTFTSISWTVTVPEVYSGFNVGVTSASFTPQAALVLHASPATIPVGNDSALSTTGGSGTGAVTYTLVSGPCTLTGSTLTGTALGDCEVTATKAGDGTHASLTSTPVIVRVAPMAAATPAAIPTLGEWSRIVLALLLMGMAGWSLRRR